jgi:hypothetical protein
MIKLADFEKIDYRLESRSFIYWRCGRVMMPPPYLEKRARAGTMLQFILNFLNRAGEFFFYQSLFFRIIIMLGIMELIVVKTIVFCLTLYRIEGV